MFFPARGLLRQPGAPAEYYLFPGFLDSFAKTKMGNEVFPSVLTYGKGKGSFKCTLLRSVAKG